MAYYLIKRGSKPDYHRAPFHPVILCTSRPVAKWQAGNTRDKVWLWTHQTNEPGEGWLLERWEGLDIDYYPLVNSCILPDGTHTAFHHEHRCPHILGMLNGAAWWSSKPIPSWLAERGVRQIEDEFSQRDMRENEWDAKRDRL